ncbi:MAG: DUF2752 domain-containing protein [Clostridia bacterium]
MYNHFMKKLDEKTKRMIFFEILVTIFVLGLYITVKTDIIKFVPHCYILEKTGLLCPSCGGTRCIKELFNLNIIKALKMNAFYTTTIIYLLILNTVYILNSIFKINKLKILYIKKIHLIIWLITLILYTVFRNIFIYINA